MRTSTPSQSEIFCLKAVIVACSMYWPFRTSTPSQSEIFCLKAVIVACSMYWPFRTSTPSQSEIFCLKAVIVACSMYWPFRTSTRSQSEIFCLKAVIVAIGLSGPAHPPKVKYSLKSTIRALRQNISLWEGVLVLKGQYSEILSQSNNNSFETEYFTLGGCAGPERPIHRTSNNNSFSQNISLLVYTL